MAAPTHDLCVKVGEYTDQSGALRARWMRIGSVFRHPEGGSSIKLDCLPLGVPEWNGWVSLFARDPNKGQPPGQSPGQRNHHGHHPPPVGQGQRPQQGPRDSYPPTGAMPFDDDIPF